MFKINKPRQSALIISIIIWVISSGIMYAGWSYNEDLTPIPPSIFESLIQVVGILFSFSVIAIFYYLGKINNQTKECFKAYLDYMEAPNQTMAFTKKMADLLAPFLNTLPPALLRGWFVEHLNTSVSNTNALEEERDSLYRQMISSLEEVGKSVKADTIWLIFLFSLSLYQCFTGLFNSESDANLTWLHLGSIIFTMTTAILFFNTAWNRLHAQSYGLDRITLAITAAYRTAKDSSDAATSKSS